MLFLTASSATLALVLVAGQAQTEIKAELVSVKLIWDQAPRNSSVDLVRFDDCWFAVCVESSGLYSQDGALRVLTSQDAENWKSVAQINSPTPNKGLSDPKFTRSPNGQLMLSALGIVPNPQAAEPVPQFGGTVRTMAWFSNDGRAWTGPERIGPEHFPFGRVVWNKDVALSYANGCICGSMQTVQFFASQDGKGFQSRFVQTLSGFFPEDAAIVFDGDTAHCLMSRVSATIGNAWQPAFHGIARPPYTDWKWKEIETRIGCPNLLRLPDQRVVAVVGLVDPQARTSLCEFDPATGKLSELLEIPTEGKIMNIGLAMHDGHLWVSYHAPLNGKPCAQLAKVKLK